MSRRLLLLALAIGISLSTSVRAQTAMAVDGPANNATVAQPFWITGWAIDTAAQSGTGIDYVHVWAYPNPGSNEAPIFFGAADLGGSRPDVATVYGSQFTNSGFGFSVLGRPPGIYELVIYAHSAVDGFTDERHITVTIEANPAMSIDGPTQNANVLQPFNVGGWAVDRAAATGTGVDTVHVYAFPSGGGPGIFIGESYMGGDRPDVGAVFGSRFTPSGFDVTFSGKPADAYQIVAYAHSTLTNTFNQAQSVNVNVDPTVAAPTFQPGVRHVQLHTIRRDLDDDGQRDGEVHDRRGGAHRKLGRGQRQYRNQHEPNDQGQGVSFRLDRQSDGVGRVHAAGRDAVAVAGWWDV